MRHYSEKDNPKTQGECIIIKCIDARSVKQCVEMATCDAYDEDELASGWLACFEEIFDGVEEVELLGEIVNLAGFDTEGTIVIAICTKGKKKARVMIDSALPLSPTKVQKLWLKAWKSWRN